MATEQRLHWAIRLRKRLLLPWPSRWNGWVRDWSARAERRRHPIFQRLDSGTIVCPRCGTLGCPLCIKAREA